MRKTILMAGLIFLLGACKEVKTEPANYILEIAMVKPIAGTSDQKMRDTMKSLDTFVKDQEGFIARDFGKAEDGYWIDVVKWKSLKAAKAAEKNAEKSSICMKAFELFDVKSIQMRHITPQ